MPSRAGETVEAQRPDYLFTSDEVEDLSRFKLECDVKNFHLSECSKRLSYFQTHGCQAPIEWYQEPVVIAGMVVGGLTIGTFLGLLINSNTR